MHAGRAPATYRQGNLSAPSREPGRRPGTDAWVHLQKRWQTHVHHLNLKEVPSKSATADNRTLTSLAAGQIA